MLLMNSTFPTAAARLLAQFGLLAATAVGQSNVQPAEKIVFKPPTAAAGVTCFDDTFNAPSHENSLSTVMILAIDQKGRVITQGSGVIVADSEMTPGKGNRIYTAGHVSGIRGEAEEPYAEPATRYAIISSGGKKLGDAEPRAIGTKDVSQSKVGDEMVLEMIDPGADYKTIPGFTFAPGLSPSGFSRAYLTGLSGIDGGISGGPAIDTASNKLLGLAIAIVPDRNGLEAEIHLERPELLDHSKEAMKGTGMPVVTGDPVTLQPLSTIGVHDVYIISPGFMDDKIVHALGNAGHALKSQSGLPQKAIIAGMIDGFCTDYAATIVQVDPHNVADFRLVGLTDDAKLHFKSWNDPAKSLSYVADLLKRTVDDPQFKAAFAATTSVAPADILARIGKARDFSEIADETLAEELSDYSRLPIAGSLQDELREATKQTRLMIDAKIVREDFLPAPPAQKKLPTPQ